MRQNDEQSVDWVNRRHSTFLASRTSVADLAEATSGYGGRRGGTGSGPSCERSRKNCGGGCMNLFQSRGDGCAKWCGATLLSRGPDQCQEPGCFPIPCYGSLATCTTMAQPEGSNDVGENHSTRGGL